MSWTQRLLARIRAPFEPKRPPHEAVDEPPIREAATKEAPPAEAAPVEASPAVEPASLEVESAPVVAEEPSAAEEVSAAEQLQLPPATEELPTATAEPDASVASAASAGGLTLRLESERGGGSMFAVTKSGATIGRGPESTIQLADLSVSRKHAKITYKQGAYWLSDVGSMGGTWLDGTKLAAPRRVAVGQTIDIGVCRLTVVSAEAEAKASAARGPSHAA